METSASEQGQPQPLKVETSASEQGQQQDKIETSLRQQGVAPVNEDLGDDAEMENMLNEQEEAEAESHVNVFNEESEAEVEAEEQEEGNGVLEEELANANQIFARGWPYGKFAMPRPADGCPRGFRVGSRYQDNEDNSNRNSKSVGVETRMKVVIDRNLRMNYCVKKTTSGPLSPRSWPAGRYCIARKGSRCPGGFRTGSVYWDDEDNRNANSFYGTLPDGVYNRNTKIYYCCRSDGSTSRAIRLPTTNNFYLYRYGSTCQRVSGMRVYTDTIYTDDEDNRNNNRCTGSHPAGTCGRNIRLYFCYYYKYR